MKLGSASSYGGMKSGGDFGNYGGYGSTTLKTGGGGNASFLEFYLFK